MTAERADRGGVTVEELVRRWDEVQCSYLPGRAHLIPAVLDAIEAVRGNGPLRVLDLAGGAGTVAARVAVRFPEAAVTVVDVDPALLALGRMWLARQDIGDRVRMVRGDLRSGAWTAAVAGAGPFDAVVVCLALHWFDDRRQRVLLAEIHRILAAGGLFVNADRLPEGQGIVLPAALDAHEAAVRSLGRGADRWGTWWTDLRTDPRLGPLVAQRDRMFSGSYRSVEHHVSVAGHIDALRGAGFAEVVTLWRHHTSAALGALA